MITNYIKEIHSADYFEKLLFRCTLYIDSYKYLKINNDFYNIHISLYGDYLLLFATQTLYLEFLNWEYNSKTNELISKSNTNDEIFYYRANDKIYKIEMPKQAFINYIKNFKQN